MINFTPSQIEEVLSFVDSNIAEYIAYNVGMDVLRPEDKDILLNHGIDISAPELGYFSPFEQSFYFGRLSEMLGDDNTRLLTYDDLLKYFARGQYLPLTDEEEMALGIAKKRSYTHIKGLGDRIRADIDHIITDVDTASRKYYEDLISDSVKRAVHQRGSVKDIIHTIGTRTQDWQRDLGRIADTELNSVYQEGRAANILKDHGGDALVYKDVFPGACRHCINLYLTGGLGSQPRIFKLKDLIANGTNIGRKVQDWKATVGSTHPWCRCQLRHIPEGYEWDKESKNFKLLKYTSRFKDLAPIFVQVGDKRLTVK